MPSSLVTVAPFDHANGSAFSPGQKVVAMMGGLRAMGGGTGGMWTDISADVSDGMRPAA